MTLYRDIPISSIDVGGRLRALDPAWVTLLAEEIAANGQSTPIRIVERGKGFKLIDGAYRIAALLQLGRDVVEARCEDAEALADDAAVRLGEIKGNMLRADLTALDRAVYIDAWCDIYRDAHEPVKRGRKPAKPITDEEREEFSTKMVLNWTEAAQRALQIGRMTVFRSQKIAAIPAALRARIALLPVAEKQTELLLLADQDEAKQAEIVGILTADPTQAETVGEALVILGAAPAPVPTPAYERMSERFARLPEREQHAFFTLHESAIDLWLARRSASASKAA